MTMYLSYDIAAIAVALVGGYIGLRWDLASGKIPNALTGAMLILSGALAYMRVSSGDVSFIALYAQNFVFGFFVGIVFWYIRAWSGGDAKMFWAICSLLPAYPAFLRQLDILSLPWYAHQFFGLSILFNLLILLLIRFFLAAVCLFLEYGRGKELFRTITSPFMYLLASSLTGMGIARTTGIEAASYLSIFFVLALGVSEQLSYAHFLALFAVLAATGTMLSNVSSVSEFASLMYANKSLYIFAFLLSAYAVGSRIPHTRKVAIKDLRAGMSLGEEICIVDGSVKREETSASPWNAFISWALKKKKQGRIVYPRPAGLSEEDLGKLRLYSDALGGFVEVSTGFILMPFIMGSLLLSFAGDILWMALT